MPGPRKYRDELRERAVGLVFESGRPTVAVARDPASTMHCASGGQAVVALAGVGLGLAHAVAETALASIGRLELLARR